VCQTGEKRPGNHTGPVHLGHSCQSFYFKDQSSGACGLESTGGGGRGGGVCGGGLPESFTGEIAGLVNCEVTRKRSADACRGVKQSGNHPTKGESSSGGGVSETYVGGGE